MKHCASREPAVSDARREAFDGSRCAARCPPSDGGAVNPLRATHPQAVSYDLPGQSFAALLRAAADAQPDQPAVIDGDTELSYRELLAAAGRLANGLSGLGVRPGDRVLTQLPNWWETTVVSWAVFLAGAVLVPVVPIYRSRELAFIIEQVQPRAVFAPSTYRGYQHAAELRGQVGAIPVLDVRGDAGPGSFEQLLVAGADPLPATEPEPSDIAVVLYTSGTTSQAKGALHSHQTLLAEIRDLARWCRLSSADRVFMPSPLSHITGLSYGVLLPVELSCAVVLQDRWDPDEAVRLVERHRCTFTVSSTPFLRGLAAAYDRPSSLGTFVCGGADIPADLVRQAHRNMGTRVVRTYGSTELPTSSMGDPFGDLDRAADGEGRAMGANELTVRAHADGVPELLVRGPELFLGYLDASLNDAAFTSAGWFRTGDQATLDPDGTVHITGRIKDIVNRGGEKYSVAEVEALLLRHPAVADVAIVGYPDPVLVERACAFVVAQPGTAPSLEDLREHLVAGGTAVQKAPEMLIILDELPRTASGKIQRFRLRDQVRAGGIGSAQVRR
ncbi:N/A [soil metagenome]